MNNNYIFDQNNLTLSSWINQVHVENLEGMIEISFENKLFINRLKKVKMKKLSLKNLKVVKMSKEEQKTIKGGTGWPTSGECNRTSGPYVSWCNGCDAEPALQ